MSKPVACHYWIAPISRGFSVMVIEQTTESVEDAPNVPKMFDSIIINDVDGC